MLFLLLIEERVSGESAGDKLVAQLPSCEIHRAESLGQAQKRLALGGIGLVLVEEGLFGSDPAVVVNLLRSANPDLPLVAFHGEGTFASLELIRHGVQDCLAVGPEGASQLLERLHFACERSVGARVLFALELDRRVAEQTAELHEALSRGRQTQEKMVQKQRLHALSHMAGGIAQDFNDSFAPILGFTNLLMQSPMLARDRVVEYAQRIQGAAREGAELVKRLRVFYRYRNEDDVFGAVSLSEVVKEVSSFTRKKWHDEAEEHGIHIDLQIDIMEEPVIFGRTVELQEMLVNLVLNSVESIEREGSILIRTRIVEREAILEVIDTGCGMTEEARLRCFEPFYSTKEKEHEPGLGLAMAYGILSRHDGEAEVESALGAGTTFRFRFPLYDGFSNGTKGTNGIATVDLSAPAHRLRILVVDDEPAVREILSICFCEEGHYVETASDGVEGLQTFQSGEWDIVVTDRAMPNMTGDRMAAAIRALAPDVPIMMVTGYPDAARECEGSTVIDVVLLKPFTMDSLRGGVKRALSVHCLK